MKLLARMSFVVSLFQALRHHMGVDLRGGKMFVPQQFLDASQIGSRIQHVGRIAVPQLMWGYFLFVETSKFKVPLESELQAPGGDGSNPP
jgi:hypothetical protein